MIVKQFYLPCLAHASYLIGDEQTGHAVVVDPQRDTEQYVTFAGEHGLSITHVFLTHLHADFVAGHLELRDRTGAEICLGDKAAAEYDFRGFADGEYLELGRVRLKVLHTPGHTPESISIVVYDQGAGDERPHAVLTGDTLFVGDVGRPDLRAALGWSATELGGMLYESLHTKLLKLPDESLIYPAHGAGSLCGKALSKETVSTLGEQRRTNYALRPMSREAFIAVVTADQPDAPAYFTYDAVLNSRQRPTLDESLASGMKPLALEEVLQLQSQGAQILDTRDPIEFAPAHLRGSINIGLCGQFATWVGTLLDQKRPIVIIASPGREQEAAVRLGRIGFDRLAGYLKDGVGSLRAREDLTDRTQRISAPLAAELLASARPPLLVDVRSGPEHESKWIGGSLGMPLNHLESHLEKLPKDQALLIHCTGGYRSSTAASLLQRAGFSQVSELAGGMAAWEAAGGAVESAAKSA